MATKDEQLKTVSEVARLTGYSTKRIDQFVRTGLVAPRVICNIRCYNNSDIEKITAHRERVNSDKRRG